jgi:chromosomal replication initiation ATPase DnaA
MISVYAMPGLIPQGIPLVLRHIKPNDVIKCTADYFLMSEYDLKKKTNEREYVYPRSIAAFIIRRNTHLPVSCIAASLGEAIKHWSSISRYETAIQNLLDIKDERLIRDLTAIIHMVNSMKN